jgi:hypothetical protein
MRQIDSATVFQNWALVVQVHCARPLANHASSLTTLSAILQVPASSRMLFPTAEE